MSSSQICFMESIFRKDHQKEYCIQFIINALIILWIYTAGSKLMDLEDFKRQLALQPFGSVINSMLVYALPAIEIFTAVLLTVKKTKTTGLVLSVVLLTVFTLYVLLVVVGYFTKMPCSCGGVLEFLSWKAHLIFNVFFLAINLIALYQYKFKKGGPGA